jgi:murein DD-endopeptidase MepM/ murein hydrolase activator NlpD
MRALVASVLLASAGAFSLPAVAATGVDTTGTTFSTDRVVVPLVFPVVGSTGLSDTYLACRSGCGRKHMGQDLMGAKMSPLLAACGGTVTSLQRETRVGGGNSLVIACDQGAAKGWSVAYLHVNNDSPGTDDGKGTKGWAFPAGLAPGVQVLAGQLVGWRGDSGNAESTGAHLHLELRQGSGWGGVVHNAYPSLKAARRLGRPLPSGPHPEGTLLRSPAGGLSLVTGGVRHAGTPGALAANRQSTAQAVPVSYAELALYRVGAPLRPRDGALVRDPAGAVWRVAGATRFPASGAGAAAVSAADLAGLEVVAAPSSPLTRGVLVRVGSRVLAVGGDGLLHVVDGYVMTSWGWTAADVLTLPADLPLPEVGEPLGFRDGTLVTVHPVGAAVLSGGVVRRLWDSRQARDYGYAGKTRLAVPAALVSDLPVGEIAGPAGTQTSGHHRRPS